MHLDFAPTPDDLDLVYVCEQTERFKWGGRVAIGHVTKLSTAPPDRLAKCAKRIADAGVALTVLPSTDLYLMGRHMTHSVMRGVTEAHKLLQPRRQLHAVDQQRAQPVHAVRRLLARAHGQHLCQHLPGRLRPRHARVLQHDHHALGPAHAARRLRPAVGKPADLVVLDAESPEQAVAELAPVLYAFKRGRRTVTRTPAVLHRPGAIRR